MSKLYTNKLRLGTMVPMFAKTSSTNYGRAYVGDDIVVDYEETSPPIDYSQEYFTIETLESDTNVYFVMSTTQYVTSIAYSFNKTSWTSIPLSTGTHTINVQSPSKMYVRCVSNKWHSSASSRRYIYCNKQYNVSGNIMSLLYGDDFADKYSITTGAAFSGLFCINGPDDNDSVTYNSWLVNASNLVMPATSISTDAYSWMFKGCKNMVYGPKEIAFDGYLPTGAFWRSFYNCQSLLESPILRFVGTSGQVCVYNCFYGCSSLQKITSLLTSYSSSSFSDWVYGVSSTGTFYKAPSMSGWSRGTSGIPSNWTVVDYAE